MIVEDVDLTAWVGSSEERTAVVPPSLDTVLRGTIGLPEDTGAGALPGLHWLLFDEFAPASATGEDGHPARGGFLPPVPLPRRMWAGGRIDFLEPLRAGDALTRTSRVTGVVPKEGRAGPLVFVTVEHEVARGSTVLIREEQDIVYMNISAAAARPEDDRAEEARWSRTVVPDPVMLFRYSALTRNSHRIHYDADYARRVELYPELVVHGPLTATLLMWSATQCAGNVPLRRFSFRGRSPLYVTDTVRIDASREGDTVEVTARNPMGGIAMSATAEVQS